MAVLQAYQTDLLKDLDKAFYKVQVWAQQPGVLAHLGLGIRDGLRRLVSRLMHLPRLQVGLKRGVGQREAKPEGEVFRMKRPIWHFRPDQSKTSTPFP